MRVGRRAEELAQPGRRGILESRRHRARMVGLGANNSTSSKQVILTSRKLYANRASVHYRDTEALHGDGPVSVELRAGVAARPPPS
jgi:hypothetical protein